MSSLRETDPWGYADQPRFLNGAAALATELPPRELLDAAAGGRARARPRAAKARASGPARSISTCSSTATRPIDEPGLDRAASAAARTPFALEPLPELDPALVVPGRGRVRLAGGATPRYVATSTSSTSSRPTSSSALKKEYTAVFRLFRYCILTQDATYLCNRLDLKCAAAELPVLPPEDGRRLGLGQEPADEDHPARRGLHLERRDRRGAARRGRRAGLTAEALAERIGESARARTTTSSLGSARMLLGGRRREHPDGVRALRGRRARRPLAARDRAEPHR